ncbi:hypothetical protein HOD61_03065 [archaeon]|jgi:hypothetical protein|nr:hypothetical protein [archaeon]
MKLKLLLLISLLFVGSVGAMSIESVDSNEFAPGEQGLINIRFENEHSFDIIDVNVHLDFSGAELPFAPVDMGSNVFIDEINDGDDELVQFNIVVLPNAELNIYSVPVHITYFGNNETYEREDMISIIVHTDPILSVIVSEPDFIVGNIADVNIKIINEGLADVKFLKVKLGNSDFFDVLSSSEIYVGELDSDDSDKVEFSIRLNNVISDSISIPVSLEYYDSSNNLYTMGDNLRINVYSEKEAKDLGLIVNEKSTWWIYLIVGFVIFAIYKHRKKKKRKR